MAVNSNLGNNLIVAGSSTLWIKIKEDPVTANWNKEGSDSEIKEGDSSEKRHN